MPEVVAQQGDSVVSLAIRAGFSPETIWDHPDNSHLRQNGRTPEVLLPGDIVVMPDLTIKEESGATEKRHKFKRRSVPSSLRIRFMQGNEPRRDEPYIITIDGRSPDRGVLDSAGFLDVVVPPDAREAVVRVGQTGEDEQLYKFALHALDPGISVSGAKHRLNSMGYFCGEENDEPTEAFADALRGFQGRRGITPTGELDQQTADAIKESYEGGEL